MRRPSAVLEGAEQSRLELGIHGYQFPEIEEDMHDSNWLMISGRVTARERRWEFQAPCLLTWEVAQLVAWLRLVAVGSHPAQLQFLEPELSFEYVATPPPDRTIRVRFSHAASPGGSSRWSRFGEGYPVDFTISPPQLEAVTEELNAALRAFPPRGKLPARCFLL